MNIITLINAADILNQFANTKVSSKLAYKIMKFCKGVANEEEFYNSKINEIINTYAEKDEDGQVIVNDDGVVRIMQDKIAEANAAMMELNMLEVDMPNVRFTLDELDGFELSATDMFVLDAFIEE